jgi:hypothetical protein
VCARPSSSSASVRSTSKMELRRKPSDGVIVVRVVRDYVDHTGVSVVRDYVLNLDDGEASDTLSELGEGGVLKEGNE